MRVLLATDRPALRDALSLYLAEQGVEIVAVAVEASALPLRAGAADPDVVLVDWWSDGPASAADLAAAITGLKRTAAAPPVVALSALRDCCRARAAGVDACATLGDPPHVLVAALEAARASRRSFLDA